MGNPLYIFLDEGGNFDFTANGTKYFTLTSIALPNPFILYAPLATLKYKLIGENIDLEYFHACEDKQIVRNQVYNIIMPEISNILIDSIIVEKRKTNPALRDMGKFYTKTLGYLLQYVCWPPNLSKYSNIVIITDRIPVNKTRKAVEKAIKETFSSLNNTEKPYQILHYDSKSSLALQVVDYINWAIYRKWDSGDIRSYNLIKHRIRSEFDIFERGDTCYY
jgi:hypothetical protein